MKKFKFPLLAALLIAAAGVFAFTMPGKAPKKTNTYYYTGGSSFTDMQNPELWEGSAPAPGCGDIGNIPCAVITDQEIETYLNSFEDEIELLGVAEGKHN